MLAMGVKLGSLAKLERGGVRVAAAIIDVDDDDDGVDVVAVLVSVVAIGCVPFVRLGVVEVFGDGSEAG